MGNALIRILALMFLLSWGGPVGGAPANKVLISVGVEINGKDGRFRAVRRVRYREILQTVPSARFVTFTLPEYPWSKLAGIKMSINAKKFGKDYQDVRSGSGDDVFLSDALMHGLFFPTNEMKVGDTLAYECTEDISDLTYLPLCAIVNVDDIESYDLSVKYPKGIVVAPRLVFVRDTFPVSVVDDGAGNLSISTTQIPKSERLSAYPLNSWHGLICLEVSANGKSLTASHPSDFVDWYKRQISLEPTLDPLGGFSARDTIGTFATPREQLSAIHDWVRTHIRYIADMSRGHSHFPHAPSDVLSLRYGDCKDRAYLVCALARQFGLTVHMGLVASTFRPDLGGLIHVYNFDHVICQYRDSSGDVFFDPTARYNAFDDVPSTILEHRAFILDPENPREAAVLSPDTTDELEIRLDAQVDSLHAANAIITVRKDLLAAVRLVRLEQTGVSLDELYRNILESPVQPTRLRSFKILEDAGRWIRFSATADISSLVVVSPSKAYLPETVFPIVKPEIEQRAKDSLPLYYDDQTAVRLLLDLRGTQGAVADTTSIWGDAESGQSATSVSTDSSQTVHFMHRVHRFRKILAGEQKTAHLKFCAQYVQVRKPMFALKREKK